jgi:hypothetical protein
MNNQISDAEVLRELKKLCSENGEIWTNINNVRETVEIIRNNAPIVLDVSFIELKFAHLDLFLRKIQKILQIPKPYQDFSLRKWEGSIEPWWDNDS